MDKRRSRFVPGVAFVDECLERRVVLSGIGSSGAAEVASRTARDAPTKTTLTVSAGTLAQPITFTATVRAAAAAGSPTGTVEILDHGQVIQTLTLSPATPTNAKSAVSEATATLTPSPGGGAYYFGKHQISAVFVPGGDFSKSTVNKTFTVSQPAYTTLAGGVQVATIAPGSGSEIQPGQTATVLYTGYLAKNGEDLRRLDQRWRGTVQLHGRRGASRPGLRRGDGRHEGRRDADHLDPTGRGLR